MQQQDVRSSHRLLSFVCEWPEIVASKSEARRRERETLHLFQPPGANQKKSSLLVGAPVVWAADNIMVHCQFGSTLVIGPS